MPLARWCRQTIPYWMRDPMNRYSQMNLSRSFTGALAGVALAQAASTVYAHDWDSARPDAHAPIAVMGDHTHKAGELMFSYRHMRMDMNHLGDGDDKIAPTQLLQRSSYMMVPTSMEMEMDMFGVMYAPDDTTTLMAMIPYLHNKMDMLMVMPGNMADAMGMSGTARMSMKSSGVGDVKLAALHNLYDRENQRIHVNLVLGLPTGSIDEEGDNNQQLPYGMQLGSGTYDLLPGITYSAQYERFSWGGQAQATLRLDKNDHDYRLGNRFLAQVWGQHLLHDRVAVSARISYEKWQNINGDDERLNRMMSPLADPALQAGTAVNAGIGASVTLPAGNRLALEYTKNLTQDLQGPQMRFDDSLVLAWQLSFK